MNIALVLVFITTSVWLVNVTCKGIFKLIDRAQISEELNQMFKWFWDGTPEDKIYAWYKVRMVLKHRQGKDHHRRIAQVDKKIMQLDKHLMHGTYSVDSDGRLLDENEEVISVE